MFNTHLSIYLQSHSTFNTYHNICLQSHSMFNTHLSICLQSQSSFNTHLNFCLQSHSTFIFNISIYVYSHILCLTHTSMSHSLILHLIHLNICSQPHSLFNTHLNLCLQSHSMFNPFITFIVWGRRRVTVILYDRIILHIWKNVTIFFLLITILIFITVVYIFTTSLHHHFLQVISLPSSLFYFIFAAVQLHTKLYGSKEELEKTATFHLADWTLRVVAIEKKKLCGTDCSKKKKGKCSTKQMDIVSDADGCFGQTVKNNK